MDIQHIPCATLRVIAVYLCLLFINKSGFSIFSDKNIKVPNIVLIFQRNCLLVSEAAHEELEACDLCLVVGTSSVVYPAAMFAPQVSLTPPPPPLKRLSQSSPMPELITCMMDMP